MGMAMELITGFVTAPGATITAVTLAAGNTLAIRNAPFGSNIWLLNMWSDHQAVGIVQLRSPRLHDNVQGIRVRSIASQTSPYLPAVFRQPLMAQDQLSLGVSGSAVGGDIETAVLMVYYEDLPGAAGRFISADELNSRTVDIVTVETAHTNGAVGGYSGEVTLNSSFDLLKANTDYALIGYDVDVERAAVGIRGSDTGNMRVGGPGDELGKDYTRSWFLDLAFRWQKAMIPVFNSANRAAILCDVADDENALAGRVIWIFAELGQGGGGYQSGVIGGR